MPWKSSFVYQRAALIAALVSCIACWSYAEQPATAPTESTAHGEKQFGIISVSRTGEIVSGTFGKLRAKDGYVFIAVAFVPVPLKTADDLIDDREAFLVDSLGEKHGTVYFQLVGSRVLNGQRVPEYQSFFFTMKKEAKPKEMLVKELRIDLTNTPEGPAKRPAARPTKK